MATFLAHYDGLLAAHYTWMAGGNYPELVAENRAFFERLGVATPDQPGAPALDLGCGSGFQSAALVALGYRVTGVDLCASLVQELRERNREAERSGQLRGVVGNLLDLELYRGEAPFRLVVCMGDTLTHLASRDEVEQMIRHVAGVLDQGGRFILRFRDLTKELTGIERFIPVKADPGKMMICFLESDAGPDHVRITDLIYERSDPAGANFGQLQKSSYLKLRISPAEVRTILFQREMRVVHEENERNLVTLVAVTES